MNPIGAALVDLLDNGDFDNGDEVLGDGVYTNYRSFNEPVAGPVNLQVSADLLIDGAVRTVWSPVFVLDVVSHMTPSQVEEIRTGLDGAGDAWEANLAEFGDTAKARKETVKAIKKLPGVRAAGVSPDGFTIWMQHDTGVYSALLLAPDPAPDQLAPLQVITGSAVRPATVAQSAEATAPKAEIGNNKVLFWEPFADDYTSYGSFESKVRPILDASVCPKFESTYVHDAGCTVASLALFPSYGTVVITGHGGVVNGQVVVSTREEVSWGDWWNGNYKDRQLIPVKVRIGYDLLRTVFKAFTPAYVSRLGDFPQSLIVNTACSGLDNDTLKDAFLGKGAAAYLGYKGAGIYTFSQGLLKT
ncbi:MAG: hypothetical protein LUP91_09795, partial [Methylococcaceae bacterium]|nr:hypothetical protein [Methylococcaceae bacterium]